MHVFTTLAHELRWLCTAAVLVTLAAACGAADTGEPVVDTEGDVFVGAVDDDLFVAVVVSDHPEHAAAQAVVVYLCDGADVAEWLVGVAEGGTATLTGADVEVSLALDGETVAGDVQFAGAAAQPFTTAPGTGVAGLYRAEASTGSNGASIESIAPKHTGTGGWIVLNEVQQRGALTLSGVVIENPTLDLATLQASTSIGTLSAERRICVTLPGGIRVCVIF
jgi:hypothetical protein